MKAGIHPVYNVATVICACGNTFQTRSTKDEIKLEICSACHPYYTGQQKLIDTAGRVERFQTRFKATAGKTVVRKPQKAVVKKLAAALPAPKNKKVLTTAPKKRAEKAETKKPAKKAE